LHCKLVGKYYNTKGDKCQVYEVRDGPSLQTGSGLFEELTQVTVTLDLLVRKTLGEPYLAIFCEPPVPKR